MKKTIFCLMLGMTLCANAQLTVLESGQTQIGEVSTLLPVDTTASLNIWKIHNPNSTQSASKESKVPYITFGAGVNASIGGESIMGTLNLMSSSSISYMTSYGATPVFSYTSRSKTFTFSCEVKAPSFLTSSDARLKSNVSSLSETYKGLADVTPVSYNLVASSESVPSGLAEKNSKANADSQDQRQHFGFIAQEVQEIFPNLVVADEEGMLSIDYTGFIPLLVEAYKDLSEKVKEQEETIASLSDGHSPSYMPASVGTLMEGKAALKQNRPNPFSGTTLIECTVPGDVASASIFIYDLQGKQITRLEVPERGDTSVALDAASMQPGMYIYSLIADGVEIDSKRMILTD